MKGLKDVVRNHLLAATMNGRWETQTEISRSIRKNTTLRFGITDLWKCMLELSRDGIHRLEFRLRDGCDHKEYRLYVREEAIEPPVKFIREFLAKPWRPPPPPARKR